MTSPFSRRAGLFALLLASLVGRVPAQADLVEDLRIPAPYHVANPGNDPRLDRADLRGDTFVISAMKMALGAGASAVPGVGAVYVYTRPGPGGGWSMQAELRPTDPRPDLYFGVQVCLDGDTVAVGAVGAAYVFERSGGQWRQTARIPRPPVARSLALDGDLLAFGDWAATVQGQQNAGRVKVYRRQGGSWSLDGQLVDDSPAAEDGLGRHLDLSGDRVIAYSVDAAGGQSNPAGLVFVRAPQGGWQLEARLQPDWGPTVPLRHFLRMSAIDISGDTVLIQGGDRAALFTRGAGTWSQTQVIDKRVWGYASGDFHQDLEGDLLAVSSLRRIYDGAGYVTLVFRKVGSTWVKQVALSQSDGYGLAAPQIDGDTVLLTRGDVASPCVTGSPPTCGLGAVYLYSLTDVARGRGAGCGGATVAPLGVRAVPDLTVLGKPTTGGQLEFFVEHAAPGSSAFLLLGLRPGFAALGGDCALHLTALPGGVGPLALRGTAAWPAGSGSVRFVVPLPSVAPGTVHVQALVLDPAGRNGAFTMSRAGEITFR